MANQWKAGIAAAISFFCFSGPAAEEVVKIEPQVAVAGVKRFGVNLGFRTSWGAEQLMSNVIMNPGFEGIVDRCLVAATPLDPHRFLDQASWLARADGFWNGATFEVLTGNSAGATGKISGSKKSGENGLPEFSADQQLPPLEAGDRISLTKLADDQLPTQWWIPGDSTGRVSVSMEPRPGSAGVRSVRMSPPANSTAEIDSYLDTIGDRAGALLPIAGNWRLKFWTRGNGPASLSVRFGRDGGRTWVDRTVAVSPSWRQTVLDFDGGEDGSHGALSLRFRASGELLLDDVDLERSDVQQNDFRSEVVDTLAAIRPAYIRDWQGQLGDTLDNRLASAEGRRASRYRPGGGDATNFFYSLPEFLDLCHQVGASPWIVAPTTFTAAEWTGLGRYLQSRAAKDNFQEVVVEFGNENWNSIFAAAGIMDIPRHAEAASRAFKILIDAAGTLPIKPILNAQYANPDSVARLARAAHAPASLAVAPYFMTELGAQADSAAALAALFADDDGKLQQDAAATQAANLDLSIYEVNMHTTSGDAPAEGRNPVLAGAGSASALAAHLLENLSLGVRRQCVYTLSGYDYKLSDPLGYIPLWGITRDLGPTHRMRPTGLALSLLNEAVSGDLYQSDNPVRDLVVAPFRSRSGWSVALASSAPDARDVRIEFPPIAGTRLPSAYWTLRAASPLTTNEDSEQVSIAHQTFSAARRVFTVHLPPYGLAVLLPEDAHDR